MTNKTKAAINKVKKESLIRDMIGYASMLLIGIGAGRTAVKEAGNEQAVKTLKTEVSSIKDEVSTIKTEVAAITSEVKTLKNDITGIATKQDEQDNKLDQILTALSAGTPASKTTAAPTGTGTPAPAPAPATPLNPRNPRKART